MSFTPSSIILYSIASLFFFFISSVLSCSPTIAENNPVSIRQSNNNAWRVNIWGGFTPRDGWNTNISTYYDGATYDPSVNEIFWLLQPQSGVYQFQPFGDFYQEFVIEVPTTGIKQDGTSMMLDRSLGGDNQKFTIDCTNCDLQTNAANWTTYHASCSIKNVASGLCMNGVASIANVNQTDCGDASKWDLLGRMPPNNTVLVNSVTPTYTNVTVTNISSDIQLSKEAFTGVLVGAIVCTTLIVLVIGYFLNICHRKPLERVDNQIYIP